MAHRDVLETFKSYFPTFASSMTMWFPNGKSSVRIRQANGQDFVFTCNGKQDWSFETVDSFIKHMKGE